MRTHRLNLSFLFFSGFLGACGALQPPDSLVELRRLLDGPRFAASAAAAPDLAAEARRSTRLSEEALEGRDLPRARWMATLGIIQARTALAVARRHEAESRIEESQSSLRIVDEDIARFESQREDAQREIELLTRERSSSSYRR